MFNQLDLFGGAAPPAMILNSKVIGRACRYCGGESWLTLPGRGPHAMGLECVTCGAHGGWAPRYLAEELLGQGPMKLAFHPDGRTSLIANHDAGSLAVVNLDQAEVLRTLPAGTGIETLSFY
jgi:hypothetical protein